LLPVSNLVPLQDVLVAERFMYFPVIGFCVLLAMLIVRGKKIDIILVSVLIGFYGCLSINRNRDWKDGFALFGKTIKVNPESFKAHDSMGVVWGGLGDYEKAIESFKEAIRINPGYALAHYNIGVAYFKLGRYDNSIESLKQSVILYSGDAEAYYILGLSYLKTGEESSAISQYEFLKPLNPALADKLFSQIKK